MKFWELLSVFRNDKETLMGVLSEPKWVIYLRWYEDYNIHVENRNRDILDAELPNDLCREALALSKYKFYIQDNILRVFTGNPAQTTSYDLLEALEVFNRFGGSCIEEVLEFGSWRIQ